MDIEKFLPIGTVVLLKGGTKKVMILSYLIFAQNKDGKNIMYDYGACHFPEGVIDSKTAVGFNQTDIEKVVHMGLKDDKEYKELKAALEKYGADMKKEFSKALDKANQEQQQEEEKKYSSS